MFGFFQDNHKAKDAVVETPQPPKTFVLTEIVGAMGLATDARDGVDPYVVVKQGGGKEIHRTKPVPNDGSPIWTIKTKSLCVLAIPDKSTETETGDPSHDKNKDEHTDFFIFEVHDGFKRLAALKISQDKILHNMTDTRKEYKLTALDGTALKRPVLALRFRKAVEKDLIFLGLKKPDEVTMSSERSLSPINKQLAARATDMNFKEVRMKNWLQQYKKQVNGVDYFKVMPCPDPDRPKEETEWMTAEQINQEALKPSRQWVRAGHGTIGKLWLEIIGCDDLPDMDMDVNPDNKADPFVGIVFEDHLVRTDMFWDDPSPRWMPWSMRAFCFNIRHPTSLLMLGVFDYDETPLVSHDPCGRVVINTANYYSDTEYLLRFNLHHDPRQMDEKDRGSILIRFRLEWRSEVDAVKESFKPPPKFIINCATQKAHQVLRYLTRGAVDMEEPTVDTVKLYAGEVASYWTRYCYFLDVMLEILLWRGRWHISDDTSLWFPIQSIGFSAFLLISLECPKLAGAMFFYMLAWSMISINYYESRHPNPWKRVKRAEETNLATLFSRPAIHIEPHQGFEDGKIVDRVNEIKGQRMSKLIAEFMYFMLKVYRIYSKTTVTAKFFSTPNNQWSFLSGRLYYLHMFLKYLCQYTRLYLALINWHGYYANKVTTMLLMLGTLFLLPPVHSVFWWTLRVLAWTLLGPWMKLVDVYWVHRWYKTTHELMDLVKAGVEPGPDLPNFEALLESDVFIKMSHSGRIIGEDAIKLKDMREHVFGQYCESVPAVDSSRFPSIPLPVSSARPWAPYDQAQTIVKTELAYIRGQKLRGSMILSQIDSFEFSDDEEGSPKPPKDKKND